MELTFERKFGRHQISTKSCFSSICVNCVFLQLKTTLSFQDVEPSQEFCLMTTAHVTAWMRFYGSSHLMEFCRSHIHRPRRTYSKFSRFFDLQNLNQQQCIPRDLTWSSVVDRVLRIFRAYEQATTSTTVQSFWQKAGFGFIQRDETYYIWVDEF
jgi:hypothetical protein